jgi:hypothetical protein
MAERSLEFSHVYLLNREARAGIFKHSMGARNQVGIIDENLFSTAKYRIFQIKISKKQE